MNLKNWVIFSLMIILVLIACDESSSLNEPEEQKNYTEEISEFYALNVGDSFTYNIDTLNQFTHNYDKIGSRTSNVNEEMGENIFLCSEVYNILGESLFSNSKFTLTNNSIEFFVDTTGISDVIPDSIEFDIELVLDETFKVVEFPLVKNQQWKVFKGSANFGTFKFSILEITGEYKGTETLQINGLSDAIKTEKFMYIVSLNIPDISNPFVSDIRETEALVWFAPEYGVVKIEGSGMFVNPITGNGFNHADSSKMIRQTLYVQ